MTRVTDDEHKLRLSLSLSLCLSLASCRYCSSTSSSSSSSSRTEWRQWPTKSVMINNHSAPACRRAPVSTRYAPTYRIMPASIHSRRPLIYDNIHLVCHKTPLPTAAPRSSLAVKHLLCRLQTEQLLSPGKNRVTTNRREIWHARGRCAEFCNSWWSRSTKIV